MCVYIQYIYVKKTELMENGNFLNPFAHREKGKFVFCPFVNEETNRS